MRIQSVIREGNVQHLLHAYADGIVRLPFPKDRTQLFLYSLPPVSAEGIDRVVRDRLRFHRQLITALKLSVHIDGSAPVGTRKRGAEHRLVHAEICRYNGIEPQITQICFVPDGIRSVTSLHFGEDRSVKGISIGERELFNDLAVYHKTQREAAALLRQSLHRCKIRKIHRLRLAVDRKLIHPGKSGWDEEIVFINALTAPGDRAGKLRGIEDLDQAVAAGNQT